MTSMPPPESQLPLSIPVHQVLLSLADADRHGYAIIQDVRQRTDAEVDLTASTLYGALARMLDAGLITEVEEPRPEPEGHDGRRRYYRITPYGGRVARAEALRLTRVLEQAHARGLGVGRARGSVGEGG